MHTALFTNTNDSHKKRPADEPAGKESSALFGKRAIIVEDEGITQMQLRQILKWAGMEVVHSAMSGPEGVEAARTARPDLVLMDIRMPGEYDGLEAASRILAEQSICVVILSAFNDDEYKERARRIGVSGFVVKPIDRDTLLPQLETAYRQWKPQ